jgi:N-acetylglutamate synthase-like GNAT family acetyltransferase
MRIRLAQEQDIPALHALIEISVRKLQAEDYAAEQLDGALGTLLGLDTQLIADGTYFIVESGGRLAGCGGWSKRRTLFGSDRAALREDDLLDPAVDAAKIRAFFVHPDFARRGVGSAILDACEKAAREAGFGRFEMGATLTGVRLFSARGYSVIERIEVPLVNGATYAVTRMEKAG